MVAAQVKKLMPTRVLGKTGVAVSIFGLGGEGVLRTSGMMKEAVPVIRRALDEGVTYFDTAPAYDQSRDYLGAALGADRKNIFLASKTHARDAGGSRRLIEDSLIRLKTEWIDLLQLHDLRTPADLDRIFAKGGALEAAVKARDEGLCRFIGITGHQSPDILLEAMRRFAFDTVLTVVNPAEPVGRSFMLQVIPEARRQNMGVIAMKVLARGRIMDLKSVGTSQKALHYCFSKDMDVAIVGCETPQEVSANAEAARTFSPLPPAELARMEAEGTTQGAVMNSWKPG